MEEIMKKLLVSLFALVLLATGCSGGGSSSDSVVCEVDGTTPMTVELTNADGKIGKMIHMQNTMMNMLKNFKIIWKHHTQLTMD
jgi:ABC-type glycerol-3-phosphate transport system substrate-binding protein